LREGRLFFSPQCKDIIREFGLYHWENNAVRDTVCKQNDHAMDDLRYFVNTVACGGSRDFFVSAAERRW
ncbi:MAG: PBSX family phage terminase large subunit, partial [Clostridia bacterium]|nr:PBSX family phage terminase large subunit [Clostridia bacterium]